MVSPFIRNMRVPIIYIPDTCIGYLYVVGRQDLMVNFKLMDLSQKLWRGIFASIFITVLKCEMT